MCTYWAAGGPIGHSTGQSCQVAVRSAVLVSHGPKRDKYFYVNQLKQNTCLAFRYILPQLF